MTRHLSYQKAAVVLVTAALIGVGASRLDVAGLPKKENKPRDRTPKGWQNPSGGELPKPSFGDIDPAELSNDEPLLVGHNPKVRPRDPLDGRAPAKPRSARSALLASASTDVAIPTSELGRGPSGGTGEAPNVAQEAQDDDFLPVPTFGYPKLADAGSADAAATTKDAGGEEPHRAKPSSGKGGQAIASSESTRETPKPASSIKPATTPVPLAPPAPAAAGGFAAGFVDTGSASAAKAATPSSLSLAQHDASATAAPEGSDASPVTAFVGEQAEASAQEPDPVGPTSSMRRATSRSATSSFAEPPAPQRPSPAVASVQQSQPVAQVVPAQAPSPAPSPSPGKTFSSGSSDIAQGTATTAGAPAARQAAGESRVAAIAPAVPAAAPAPSRVAKAATTQPPPTPANTEEAPVTQAATRGVRAAVAPPARPAPVQSSSAASPEPAAAFSQVERVDPDEQLAPAPVVIPRSMPAPPPPPPPPVLAERRTETKVEPAALAPVRNAASAGFIPASATRLSHGDGNPPQFTEEDELILNLRLKGASVGDSILAYADGEQLYLPLGALARLLDLAIVVDPDGRRATGWTLDEQRTLTIDLDRHVLVRNGAELPLSADAAAAVDGELYLSTALLEEILPLLFHVDLRRQSIELETKEPFPIEARIAREAQRTRLAAFQRNGTEEQWQREETPWHLAALPLADLEVRAVSDNSRGERVESDIRLAGDLAYLTAEAFLAADTQYGLTGSSIRFGRVDPDAELLGPLKASEFSFGDISSYAAPIGLRSTRGRGLALSNSPVEVASVFDSVDLRGALPDGYEAELYRNEVLIASTSQSQNGQYEFLQVPVEFGLNQFRIVFYGLQGQRHEEVRQISVGDGRLKSGQLLYRFGAVQKDENLLGVRDPFYTRPDDFGDWRINGEVSYGISSRVTAVASAAWFETPEADRWLVSGGIRTGVGPVALKSDVAFADEGAYALSAGIGARIGKSSLALEHTNYSGDFIDETRIFSREPLRHVTELDFNSVLQLGSTIDGLTVPLTARFRHYETVGGRKQTDAALRASTRSAGVLISNTLEYQHTQINQLQSNSQLFGNFDLTSLAHPGLRTRGTIGYRFLPQAELVSVSVEADYEIDDRTSARGRFGYSYDDDSALFGLSVVREFERFTLALDGNVGVGRSDYSLGLRFITSLGRDPLRRELFVTRPGSASQGGASLRAFQDLDGDGIYGPSDRVLPDVTFATYNQTAQTDQDGFARIDHLGTGRPITLKLDPTSLPDISLGPVSGGIEIVPRPGVIHATDFAVVALSEIEGITRFESAGSIKGVSGVRLQLIDARNQVVAATRTEIDGYYFFEEVRPGPYRIVVDEEQASRLNLCLSGPDALQVGNESDVHTRDLVLRRCSELVARPSASQPLLQ